MDFDFGETTEKEDLGKKGIQIETFNSDLLSARNLAVFSPCDFHGALRIMKFQAKADKDYESRSTFSLCRLPQSKIRILGALSRINFSLSCEAAMLGWSKFKKRDQQWVEKKFDGFGKVSKVNGESSFLEHLPTQTITVDSLEGAFLLCTTDGPGKKGDFIDGYLIYVKQ